MRRRGVIGLLLLFVALAVVAVLQMQPPVPPSTEEPLLTSNTSGTPDYFRVFPDMAVLDIQAIRLRDPNSEREFVISRGTDGQWIAPDVGSDERLDTEAASNISKTVVLLYYARTLPLENNVKLADYGFDPNGDMFIEVLLRNGEGHVVAIGTLSGSRTVYYAMVDNRQEIYLLERAPVDYLITQLADPPLT